MINEIRQDASERMSKAVDALGVAFSKIRTGRPSPGLLDGVKVNYYGTDTPLKQVASVSVDDSRNLIVSPWEKKILPAIEKAILSAGLGLNPTSSGELIRIPMPALTEETRKNHIRQARNEAEQARVAIRNIRRDANGDFKELLKEKEISEDDLRRAEEEIQKLTDRFIKEVDALLATKETDLMEI
ncbi:MAG: ribosome recycling factor [Pseudomonadales bacterium]|nr:ribosome recycling factor [Pseudomonadales bacterium]MCC6529086.1 ribosome recycling factor [Pseudomonadales bacterium]MCP5333981.1 ribosome recycling factor [Pseudomonadales bacterium]HMU90083.1 ribosome recycling factor [Pseudomonadales bacterium]HMW14073.1 ribosome recycling factor [Pseudomonadales bacterium]